MRRSLACLVSLAAPLAVGCTASVGVRESSTPATLITEYTHGPTGRLLFVKAGTPQAVAIEWLDVLGKAPDRTTLSKLVSDKHAEGLLAVLGELPSGGNVYFEAAWGDFTIRRGQGPVNRFEDESTGRVVATDPAATTGDSETALRRLVAASSEADLVALMKEAAPKGVRSCYMQLRSNLDVSVRVLSQPVQ